MTEVQLSLTEQERAYLLDILQRARQEARVEERRTMTTEYREQVVHEEEVLDRLLKKLQAAGGG